ncbi:MAG: glycosyltransferase family 4 protein [Chloroflexi bacterium]|nr:glycosyltransferase family 4 protein [Chloroflexota bacterium]
MRIAQIAPPMLRVPPERYGGTERVIYTLTEELARRGHEVTLFASGDSVTSARLVSVVDHAIWSSDRYSDHNPFVTLTLARAYAMAGEFDLIHSHLDYFAFPFARQSRTPTVSTLHGRLDLPELQPLYREFRDLGVVSISNNQRRPLPFARWLGTVYNGIRVDQYQPERRRGKYLAFLGRISPEKRLEWAIEVARRAQIPLKIAARKPLPCSASLTAAEDNVYYEQVIKPLLDHPLVEYVGEISQAEKSDFLGQAYALLFTADWPEPFGLVMVEALACGTPVIAKRVGSVQEVIRDGETGFICDSVQEMVLACDRVPDLDRAACRRDVEARFSARAMADGYEAVYRRLVAEGPPERSLNGLLERTAVPDGIATLRPVGARG